MQQQCADKDYGLSNDICSSKQYVATIAKTFSNISTKYSMNEDISTHLVDKILKTSCKGILHILWLCLISFADNFRCGNSNPITVGTLKCILFVWAKYRRVQYLRLYHFCYASTHCIVKQPLLLLLSLLLTILTYTTSFRS